MNHLNSTSAAATLHIARSNTGHGTLLDQVAPYLTLTPGLILDIEGILLTSMAIGELLNVVTEYKSHWGVKFGGLYLVHVSDDSWWKLVNAHLTELMRPFPTADAAARAFKKMN